MDIIKKIAEEINVMEWQVEAAVKLIDEGSTIPFIARYRKEATGMLDDTQLRTLGTRLTALRNLEEKKQKIRESITEQGKMTEELEAAIEAAETSVALDDIYRPYRPKRTTRATIAEAKGLKGLADIIFAQETKKTLAEEAEPYLNEEKGVNTVEEAIQGACDIIAERISDDKDIREYIRRVTESDGFITSNAKDKEVKSVYENYYEFTAKVSKIEGFKVLAINRGENEKFLDVKIEAPVDVIIRWMTNRLVNEGNENTRDTMKATVEDSYDRLIAPSIEREVRNALTEKAEDGAVSVFGKNLRQPLMQPPYANAVVLGWDPAFRTGCKLAVVDPTGKVLDTAVIYPTAPTNEYKQKEASDKIKFLVKKYNVTLISVGNGTASRESEQFLVEVLKEIPEKVFYVITNEAGASVYSASELADKEFPNFDVGQRSATSIARRVQDPLAELVKIDPKSIGVGQYQHDVDQKKLGESLDAVVEDCVNEVGVDLNTASAPLLQYISGITKTTAANIVAYREANGRFVNRRDLLNVPKIGSKAFEQAAGFMRISGGDEALDNTGVHPESYEIAEKLLENLGLTKEDIAKGRIKADDKVIKKTASDTGVGEVTVRSVLGELTSAGRDPRDEAPAPILRSDVMQMEDLKEGMVLKGTVRNVVDFGAFVDIGVHQDGLVHISQLTNKKFVKHPLDVVSVGDIVEVKVLSVDIQKKRIGLTMII